MILSRLLASFRTTNAVGLGVNHPVRGILRRVYMASSVWQLLGTQTAHVQRHELIQWMAVEVIMW